ncbi:MAG TPA: hypothetical protein VJW55_00845, partial [Candidatus Angelobacter sp.]|nr:hypothetical protein [Candidatus Angelobacter sp.]
MKENEKEEILKRLGLPPDAPPDTISDRIAQLNQNYQVLARVPAKRALASEWLRFLDYAQGVLLGMPPQLRPDSPGESSQIRNTEPAAAQKPEQQLEHKEGLLAATEPGDSGLTTNGSIPKAHNQVRTGDTEENSFPGCEQPELIALQAILAPAPIELVKKPIAIPWWLTPGMIMALFLAPLLFHLKSSAAEQKNGAVPKQAISHATSLLRLGIYDWPSVVVHYSAVSDPSASIEVTTVHDIGSLMAKPGGPPISFNLIVVPFSAAVENSQTLKDAGWKLVWVCDESNGMDR